MAKNKNGVILNISDLGIIAKPDIYDKKFIKLSHTQLLNMVL